MKVKLPGVQNISIRGDYIRLDSLLKLASVTSTGGEAKLLIQNGEVFVDNEICVQRGKKLRNGNVVRYCGDTLIVRQSV